MTKAKLSQAESMAVRRQRATVSGRFMFRLFSILFSLFLFSAFAHAQSQPNNSAPRPTPTPPPTDAAPVGEAIDDTDEVIRVSSKLVVVPVSVLDQNNQPVTNLTIKDFRLDEDGRAQEIANVGAADATPLDIALLLDTSSSVRERFEFERQSATRFLQQVLRTGDRAALFSIGQKPLMLQTLADVEATNRKLATIPAANKPTATAFYDTVTAAARYLNQNSKQGRRRVIVVITDGEDNFSDQIRDNLSVEEQRDEIVTNTSGTRGQRLHQRALARVARELQQADAVFYSINPSGESLRLNVISRRAQEGMQQLATQTGGTSFISQKIENLEQQFRQIALELRAQYLLQYYSNADAPAGKFLTIRVQNTTRPNTRVKARRGYYATKTN